MIRKNAVPMLLIVFVALTILASLPMAASATTDSPAVSSAHNGILSDEIPTPTPTPDASIDSGVSGGGNGGG